MSFDTVDDVDRELRRLTTAIDRAEQRDDVVTVMELEKSVDDMLARRSELTAADSND